MARVCDYCGRKTMFGNQITRRGKAKREGGVGRKITGCTPRFFKPNVQKVRAMVNGTVMRVSACARCIKAGKVRKPA